MLRERAEIELILEDSPSPRRAIPEFLAKRSDGAIRSAARSLELHGQPEAAERVRQSRMGTGYGLDNVLGSSLPDSP